MFKLLPGNMNEYLGMGFLSMKLGVGGGGTCGKINNTIIANTEKIL